MYWVLFIQYHFYTDNGKICFSLRFQQQQQQKRMIKNEKTRMIDNFSC